MPCNNGYVNGNRFLMACFVIILTITLSIFIAPFSLEKGTVNSLDGSAWRMDYCKKWNGMPLFPRLVYYFGDMNCHQKCYRSYFLNENQMPVCARDTGMLMGLSLGFFVSLFAPTDFAIKNTAFNFFHRRINDAKKLAILFACLFLPSVIDGFLQMYTGYESMNPVRTATGFLLGVGIAFLASILFLTDPRIGKSF